MFEMLASEKQCFGDMESHLTGKRLINEHLPSKKLAKASSDYMFIRLEINHPIRLLYYKQYYRIHGKAASLPGAPNLAEKKYHFSIIHRKQ